MLVSMIYFITFSFCLGPSRLAGKSAYVFESSVESFSHVSILNNGMKYLIMINREINVELLFLVGSVGVLI